MTHHTPHPRRILAAATVAALLGIAAMLSLSPAPASASYGNCDPGDFCLYYYGYVNKYGGIYHYGGSDSDLRNDRFERNHTNTRVANNAAAAWVNGHEDVRDDVIIYHQPGHRGADACIKRGDSGMLPIDVWFNKVQSYKWATNAQCRAAGVIDL